jgi:hypothetical protein
MQCRAAVESGTAGPKAVIKYLGRYTHRIAISNNRLVSMDEKNVAFKWKDYADGNRQKIMALTIVESSRLLFLHSRMLGWYKILYYRLFQFPLNYIIFYTVHRF